MNLFWSMNIVGVYMMIVLIIVILKYRIKNNIIKYVR